MCPVSYREHREHGEYATLETVFRFRVLPLLDELSASAVVLGPLHLHRKPLRLRKGSHAIHRLWFRSIRRWPFVPILGYGVIAKTVNALHKLDPRHSLALSRFSVSQNGYTVHEHEETPNTARFAHMAQTASPRRCWCTNRGALTRAPCCESVKTLSSLT